MNAPHSWIGYCVSLSVGYLAAELAGAGLKWSLIWGFVAATGVHLPAALIIWWQNRGLE